VATGTGLAVRAVPLAVFRVTSDLRPYAVVAIGGSAAQALFQIAMLAAGWGVVGFVAGGAIAAWLGALGAVLWLRPTLRRGVLPDFDARRLALWSLVGGVFNRAVASLDRIAVLVWSTIDMLGVYGTAARWSLPVRMVSGGAKLALAPALSREEHAGRSRDASTPLVAFVTLLAWMAVVLQLLSWCLVLTAWRPLAGEFQRLLSILLAAQILGCISLIGQVLLYYAGRSQRSAGLAALSAGLTVVGLLTLVPRFGARGAAFAELCATATSLGVLAFAARGVPWGSPRLLRPLAVVAGTCAAPWFLGPTGTGIVSLTGCLVLGRWVWSEARASGVLPVRWSSWAEVRDRRRR
jgi:O-antigen/teichoic acid export membrane protein